MIRKNKIQELIQNNCYLIGGLISLQFIGIFGFFIKYKQLEYSGFQVVSRTMGLVNKYELSFLQKLTFFREDFLFNLILVPFVAFLTAYLLKRKLHNGHLYVLILFSTLLSFIFYIDLYALTNIGNFLSFDMLIDSIRWATDNPGNIKAYLSISGLIKLILIVLFSISLLFLTQTRHFPFVFPGIVMVVMVFSLLHFMSLSYVNVKPSYFHKSVIQQTIKALRLFQSDTLKIDHLEKESLEKYFHTFTGVNLSAPHKNKFKGSEINSDILLFVMETIPNSIVDFTQDTNELPGISRLVNNAFISSQHFTTYPYTTNALFSLLSSRYPLNIHKSYLNHIADHKPIGLMSILKKEYHSTVYSAMENGYFADIPLYTLLGSHKMYLSPEEPFSPDQIRKKTKNILDQFPYKKTASERQSKPINDLLYFDLMAFEKMKTDIKNWKIKRQKFIALYLPQLSHGPWKNLYNRKNLDIIGRDLALIQLKWLDELILFLDQNQWLKNTIILVTSDHGVRTKEEYPKLPPGMINNYSFNVPLLLYLPNTLNGTRKMDKITSHIDIMPTLLHLLNIPRHEYIAQGIPFWDNTERTVFFLGDNYFAADAYYSQKNFYMHQSVAGVSLKSQDINFDYNQDTIVTEDKKIIETFDILYSISKQWANSNRVNYKGRESELPAAP